MKYLLNLVFLLLCAVGQTGAQHIVPDVVPQRDQLNTALVASQARLAVELPVSSIYVRAYNTGFPVNGILQKEGKNILRLNATPAIGRMNANQRYTLGVDADMSLFGIRFAAGQNHWFSLGASERIQSRLFYNRDVATLAWSGNAPFIGEVADLTDLGLSHMHWREYGIGYTYADSAFSVGGRISMLQGIAHTDMRADNLTVETDARSHRLVMDIQGWQMRSAGLYAQLPLSNLYGSIADPNFQATDSLGNYGFSNMMWQKNIGVGVDLGFQMQLADRWSLYGGVNDLGFINWNQALQLSKDTLYTFSGLEVDNILEYQNDEFPLSLDSLASSITGALEPQRDDVSRYRQMLPAVVHVGGRYQLDSADSKSLGVLLRAQMQQGFIQPDATISYQHQVSEKFSWLVSWRYRHPSKDLTNVGAGFAVGKKLQFYAVVDNLPSFVVPDRVQNASVHFGLNIIPGFDEDGDGLTGKRDECPDDFGTRALRGCPDRDGDKVADHLDACPDAGIPPGGCITPEGCPDSDCDGIADKDDHCPYQKVPKGACTVDGCLDSDCDGVADNDLTTGIVDQCPDTDMSLVSCVDSLGCPDRDCDGVGDKDDLCPDQGEPDGGCVTDEGCPDRDCDGIDDQIDSCPDDRGPTALNGCPDSDGDGEADPYDDCPDHAGPCPDADNDGVPDFRDKCKYRAGLVGNNGCPEDHDSDGDGVPDLIDNCPDIKGDNRNGGCPLFMTDKDGDGVMDNVDRCPETKGSIYSDGCPMDDRDGDLVPDSLDKCPDNPGALAYDGCPVDQDTDGDGFPDWQDNCPALYGETNQGCDPLTSSEDSTIRRAIQDIQFDYGSARLRWASYKALNQLADLILDNPDAFFLIQGHTDSISNRDFNQKLSEARALSVKRYLIKCGVSPDQLKDRGFGEDRPIDSNKTEKGRQKNRRVEIYFVKIRQQ